MKQATTYGRYGAPLTQSTLTDDKGAPRGAPFFARISTATTTTTCPHRHRPKPTWLVLVWYDFAPWGTCSYRNSPKPTCTILAHRTHFHLVHLTETHLVDKLHRNPPGWKGFTTETCHHHTSTYTETHPAGAGVVDRNPPSPDTHIINPV
jgi:hypothetical protein